MPHAESPPMENIDLFAPFERDVILEVRMGKMTPMPGLKVQSGIDKKLCDGPVWVTKLGIEGDEHDLTFHGGVDKAVHGYCSSHYPSWQEEFPTAADRFVPGGFGENLVTAHMNERNTCIGDIFAIGNGEEPLLLQVSLPRRPCYKLNHRFQLKNFAPNTYQLSRSGWYYRVIREGPVQAGDEIRLQERFWPEWTIERIQEYLHRQTDNEEMNKILSAIDVLGDESRNLFLQRVERVKTKVAKKAETSWVDYQIVEKIKQTPRITSFILETTVKDTSTDALHGAHVKLKLGNGLLRTYSVVSGTPSRFELGISLDENSRGGSRFLHEQVKPGDMIQVGAFSNNIIPNNMAANHVIVVGGVGITAFLSLAEFAVSETWGVEIHYAVRSLDEVAFRNRLDKLGDRVRVYNSSRGDRLSIDKLLREATFNSNFYFCGPNRLMDEAMLKTKAAGYSEKEVHFEAFSADLGGDPFEVSIVGKDTTLEVGEDETLLEVLRKKLGEFPSSCEVGNCGTCKVKVKAGKVEHRGTGLTDEEKLDSMLTCVSRGIGRIDIEF